EDVAAPPPRGHERLGTERYAVRPIARLDLGDPRLEELVEPTRQDRVFAQGLDLGPERPLLLAERGVVLLESLSIDLQRVDELLDLFIGAIGLASQVAGAIASAGLGPIATAFGVVVRQQPGRAYRNGPQSVEVARESIFVGEDLAQCPGRPVGERRRHLGRRAYFSVV